MIFQRIFQLLLIFLALAFVSPVQATNERGIPVGGKSKERRVALVIGNADYKVGKLRNPVNDARDVAARLEKLGFEVTRLLNADQRKMDDAARKFTRKLQGDNTVGLFYFAGHGVEVDRQNYLVPIGANIQDETEVKYEAVNAGRILDGMKRAGNGLNLVVLDACRNNPYSRGFRSATSGLAEMRPATGTLILYATEPGKVAQDGKGRNGVFTEKLLDAMDEQGATAERVFKSTLLAVNRATGGKQRPWQEGAILGNFYFWPGPPPPPGYGRPVAPPVPAAPVLKGYLQIVVGPVAAQVSVNGRPAGRTQPGKALELRNMPVGQAAVVVSAPGHKGVSRTVVIQPNQWTQEMMTLVPEGPALATLTVRSNVRGDTVSIDSKSYGPTRVDAELSPGPHVVEVSKAEHETWRETVTLSAGEKRTLRARLERQAPSAPATPAPVSRPAPRRQASRQSYEPEMVSIRGGCYQMGSPSGEKNREGDERRHRVCVEDFKIGKYEVTQSQWRSVMGNNPSTFSGCDNCPVEQVSWNDVNQYIDKLNRKTGKRYRLPTEAQWEYAARAGTTGPFSFSGRISADKVNYNASYTYGGSAKGRDRKKTVPVGSLPANPWGLHEVHGNVWEWTCSGYDKDYGGGEKRCVSKNHAGNLAIRGGSWFGEPWYVRSADRSGGWPGHRDGGIGFRLAQD